MKKQFLSFLILCCIVPTINGQSKKIEPISGRVNIQTDTAMTEQIIANEWVAVGTKKSHTLSHDYNLMFNGSPSYRFELKADDNTLENYGGGTKGRIELSYAYATHKDFANQSSESYDAAQKMKTVYHYGKGFCEQGKAKEYEFSVYIPSSLSKDVQTIFAQWHGAPDRRLAKTPTSEVKMLSVNEFLELYEHTIFKKDTGHEKIKRKNKDGIEEYKAGKPNGWKIEQGGYPPLAFGFANGYFYIKTNSDRAWMSDKTDRCNASVGKDLVQTPVNSKFKSSMIAYQMPFEDFPKDCWVTFKVKIDWTKYGGKSETIDKMGKLDVSMIYTQASKTSELKIVEPLDILIGRNDEDGYYFKFGIYRVGNSTEPVLYNLAGYSEH